MTKMDRNQKEEIDALMKMRANSILSPEDLPEHLQRYVDHTPNPLGALLKHPFLVTPFPIMMPMPLQKFLDTMQERVDQALAKKDMRGAMVFITRPFRMSMLIDIAESRHWEPGADAEEFWRTAAWVWTDAEENEEDPIWKDLLESSVPCREAMMGDEDREELENMEDCLLVYRGAQFPSDQDEPADIKTHSWTLDDRVADKFAHRFLMDDHSPWMTVAQIRKSKVIAYLSGRGESEIIADPDDFVVQSWRRLDEPGASSEITSFKM